MKSEDDISMLYDILDQKDGWFKNDAAIAKKCNAIRRLVDLCGITSIPYVVRFLTHDSPKIRGAALRSISTLLEKHNQTRDLEPTLRSCDLRKSDLRKYLKYFEKDELCYPLAIASMNGNGYIREAALIEIYRNDLIAAAFPFVVYRLGDWVKEVRRAAEKSYAVMLDKEEHAAFWPNLRAVFGLRKVQRVDLGDVYNRTIRLLLKSLEETDYSLFYQLSERDRFDLCREMLKAETITDRVASVLVNDQSYLVRSQIAQYLDRLVDPNPMIEILRVDRSNIVRQRCLESCIRIDTERERIDFVGLLTDRSATVRGLARYYLKEDGFDVKGHYQNLLEGGVHVETSIYGIGDIGGGDDVDLLLPFVKSNNRRVKKAAIRVLLKLDPRRIESDLVLLLDSSDRSLRKLAINYLSIVPSGDVLARCREIYDSGGQDLKLSMLSFFLRVGGFGVLGDLMKGTVDDDFAVASFSWSRLSIWRRQSTSSFKVPSESEKLSLRTLYDSIQIADDVTADQRELWDSLPFYGRF